MKFPYSKFELEQTGRDSREVQESPELVELEQGRLALAKRFASRMAEKLQIKIEKGGHTLVPALGEGVLVTRAVRGIHEISGEPLKRHERALDILNAVASATMWTCLLLGKYDKAAMAKGAVFSLTWVVPALQDAAEYAKQLGDDFSKVMERIASSTPLVQNMVGILEHDDLEEVYEGE